MNLVLEKFPNFRKSWQEHLNWWGGDKPGFGNDMSAFYRYVHELLVKDPSTLEIKEIFSFIEFLMQEGDQSVGDVTATCFLENLINAVAWKTIPASSFVPLLGEKSREYCKGWDEFCGDKTEGLWSDIEKK